MAFKTKNMILATVGVAGALYVAGAVAKGLDILPDIAADPIQLLALLLLVGFTLLLTRRGRAEKVDTRTLFLGICAIAVSQALSVTEEIPALRGIPLIGEDGGPSEIVETILISMGLLATIGGSFVIIAQMIVTMGSLRESEGKYRAFFEHSTDFVYVVRDDGTFLSINEGAERLTGWTRDELMGMHYTEYVAPEQINRVDQAFGRVFDKGEPLVDFAHDVIIKDGSRRRFQTSAGLILNKEGQVIGVQGCSRDITERAALQRQLIQSEKLAALGKLVSGVAHELNNPLTGVLGYGELIAADGDATSKIKSMALKVVECAERSKKVVENLLSFARQKDFERTQVKMNEVVESAVLLREHHFKVNNVTINRQYGESLPMLWVDEDELAQVFLNLLNNGFDAISESGKSGTITVSTEKAGRRIFVTFEDTGPGVQGDIAARIFDPFVTTKEVGRGTGLGLAVSHGIVERHGGRIYHDRSCQDGARFVVELPLLAEPLDAPPDDQEEEEKDIGTPVGDGRILVVDDEQVLLDFLRRALETHGYSVVTTDNGEEAQAHLENQRFDLLITDMKMPGTVDGKALCELACRNEGSTKVIIITGDTVGLATDDSLKGLDAILLPKPFSVKNLLRTVNKALNPESV